MQIGNVALQQCKADLDAIISEVHVNGVEGRNVQVSIAVGQSIVQYHAFLGNFFKIFIFFVVKVLEHTNK